MNRTGTASSSTQLYSRWEAVRRATFELSGDRSPALKVERVIVLGRGGSSSLGPSFTQSLVVHTGEACMKSKTIA